MTRRHRPRLLSLLLFLVTVCFQIANADIFSGNDASISQDFLNVDPTTGRNQLASDKGQTFQSGVAPVRGTLEPSKDGDRGLLFDFGNGCSGTAPTDMPKGLAQIALVQLVVPGNTSTPAAGGTLAPDTLNCTVSAAIEATLKLRPAGIIVYSARAPAVNEDKTVELGLTSPDIPTVFWVQDDVAAALRAAIQAARSAPPVPVTGSDTPYRKFARVNLLPAEQFFPGVWEFTLIIVVVLLTLSFATSVAMHCHLYRVRQRHRGGPGGQANTQTRTRKTLLEKSVLESFPLVTYTEQDAEAARMAEAGESTSRLPRLTEECDAAPQMDPAAIPLPPSTRSSSHSSIAIHEEAEDATVDQDTASATPATIATSDAKSEKREFIVSTCAVCLDDFEPGDQLRELPCGHRYHNECIDPWLTEKSSACPMCKTDFYRPSEDGDPTASADASTSPRELESGRRDRSRTEGALPSSVAADETTSATRSWFRRRSDHPAPNTAQAADQVHHRNLFARYVARRRQERRERRARQHASDVSLEPVAEGNAPAAT